MTSRSTRPQRRLAALALSLASSLLTLSPRRADVVAVGDVAPAELLQDMGPLQFGGTASGTVKVGVGASDFSAGQLVIDIPEDTDPLFSPGGVIGDLPDGQGLVRIVGLNSAWVIQSGGTSPDPNNPWFFVVGNEGQGFLDLIAGARVTPDGADAQTMMRITLGLQGGSQGFVSIDGFASIMKSLDLTVGERGQGTLTLLNRARVDTREDAIIGQEEAPQDVNDVGQGYVIVDGQGTRWNVGDTNDTPPNNTQSDGVLTVGYRGRGTLEIRNGGWTRVNTDTRIGFQPDSFGEAIVNGQNSLLWTFEDLFVGNAAGTAGAELSIQNKGLVRADNVTRVGELGFITMSGVGTLLTPTVINDGVIRGDGRVDTGLTGLVANNGYIRNAAGVANTREKLIFTGLVTNNNVLESVGGEMEFQAPFVNNANIVGVDAIFRFNGGLANGGNLYLKNSIVYTLQTVQNTAAALVMEGESYINGNFATTGQFTVEVGHTSSLLSVNGNVTLGGNLLVTAVDDILGSGAGDGYFPGVGDSFEIITGNSVTGTFLDIDDLFPTVDFAPTYLADRVLLTAFANVFNFDADFNNDGIVDAFDFFEWQTNNGTMVPPGTMGDADGDGDVDATDLQIWQDQFGGPPVAVAAAGSVPEPAAAVLALAGLALPLWRRRR